ncbi:Voltage-dependent calcium channel beta subunit-associated regulatory protein [Bagarius yarrelli]|uniref:Voltage-dependent calcium channel beta subunit-associated regulatory protein n=1 Tax=Bagarius yarrelli TaxID=175774 RepID=A0A556TS38_BAGYA|nr:Voltage-dependent calcium channel beta subunit-associated regulatory protein [Bagarius yarrelli]
MSNESAIWKNLTEDPTELPPEHGVQDGYILYFVLLSIFLVVTLVLLSVLLIVCRRCCRRDWSYARRNDDLEKPTTSYVEETQLVHEITIRVDESECLSAASSHDMETERFLSTGSTGRRVSFNEAALFDHSKKAQEKGRRYTLTEGDFHHLKNARLTHLHLPPAALKIVTIHECESSENSVAMTTRPVAKSSLSIFQPPMRPLPQTALSSLSPSSALPGDALNSTVDASFCESPPSPSSEPRTSMMEITSLRNGGSPSSGRELALASAAGVSSASGVPQGPVMHFFTKLRRHASLEGASPYLKIKRWKLDSSQRASSLETRAGSPKRRPFQRQRAASESMDQDENGAHHIDLIQYIARTKDVAYCPPRLLSPPSTPPPSLGRLEVEVMVEPSCSRAMGPGIIGLSAEPQDDASIVGCRRESTDHQSLYRDIWTLRASLEQYISSDQSSNNDKDSVHSDADSVSSLRTEKRGLPSYSSQDIGDGIEGDAEMPGSVGLEKRRKQHSVDSEKGTDESSTRKLLQMDSGYASIDAPSRVPEELCLIWSSSGSMEESESAVERRQFFTSSGHRETVFESFDTDIFDEELEQESGASGGDDAVVLLEEGGLVWSPYGQMFTQSDAQSRVPPLSCRDYSIDEKTDALFHEFLRHDPQFDQQESPVRSKHRSRVHLRKQWQRSKQYSDPGQRFQSSFDRYRTPLRRGETVNYPLESSYHGTLPRIASGPDEENNDCTTNRAETADRRLASLKEDYTKHSSDTSKDLGEKAEPAPSKLPPVTDSTLGQPDVAEDTGHTVQPLESTEGHSPPQLSQIGYGPQTIMTELSDKLSVTFEERLYSDLRRTKEQPECLLTATHASPDHSPV